MTSTAVVPFDTKEGTVRDVTAAWLFMMRGDPGYRLPAWFDRSVRSWIIYGADTEVIIQALVISANRPDLDDDVIPRYSFGVIRNLLGDSYGPGTA